MKKQMKLFTYMTKPLVLFMLLFAMGVGSVWGYSFNYPHLYFYNSGTEWTNEANKVMFFYYYHRDDGDKKQASQGFNMSKVNHTKLWYVCASENRGGSLSGFSYGFGATSDWPWEEGDNWSTRWTYMCDHYNHSGTSQTNLPYGTYLCTSSGADNLSVTTLDDDSEEYTPLNHTQTVKKYTRGDGEGSYTAASVNSGTVSISAYKMTGSGIASNTDNSATLDEDSETSANVDAAYTGEVTMTASANSGYVFMGWYDSENGTNKLESNSSYNYNAPNSTKTVYARFAEKLPVGKTLYLATNAKWRENSARFAAVFCNASTQQWENCSAVAETDDMYSVSIPDGDWGCVIFCKMKNSSDDDRVNKWDNRWCQTDDMYKSGLNNCVYITGDCNNSQRFGKYAPVPAIVGEMNDWNPIADQFSGSPLRLTMDLPAGKPYNFKVAVGKDDSWYGYGSTDNDLTYAGQTDEATLTTGNHNVMLLTAPAGTYTFEWDDSDNGLTISYPVTAHPSTNYVYMEKYGDWNSGTHCYIHYWYTSGSDIPLTSGDKDLKMTAYTTIGGTDYYLFPKLTDYPKFKAASSRNGEGNHTDDMVATGHGGQCTYWKDETDRWTWKTFTVRIQLNDLSATTAVNPTYMDVAFNSDVLSDLTSVPQKSYYDFGGFCVNSDGTGTKVIGEDGKWIKSVPEYTTADAVWIHEGTSTTFYAQWIEKKHTVTIAYKYGETSIRANGSVANVGVETAQDATAPFITGYVFTGWTLVDGVTTASELSGSTISIHATADSKTITANYVVRYGLVGSLKADGEPSEGMPGWPTECSICGSDFAYNAESSNYTLTVNLTKPNATYKFRIVDRTSNIWCGAHQDNVYVAENTSKTLKAANGYNDAEMGTAGRGNYTFTVTEVTDDGVWPQVTISNPVSRLVTLGHKSVTVEGNEGVIGTIVAKDAANNEYTSGQYIANGETVTIVTTCPDDYKLEGLYSNSSYSGGTIYSSWTVIEAVNAYAKFVEKTKTFEGDVESHETEWNNTDNWSAGHLPTINEVAIIQKPVVVDITDAKAKRVLLMQNGGHTGSIDIPAGKELVVRTTIRKTTDGSTYGATGENDIIIGSTLLAGNGALVMGANDGTNKATVYFATKAKTVEQAGVKHNVNQFIGTPFNDQGAILYNYYGTKIYRFMAAHDGNLGPENEWKRVQSNEGMNGFFGYNILTNQTSSPVLEMTGTLCRTTHTETISGYHKAEWDSTENMFANSWVAPIYIPNFKDTCFVNIEKTIYIFNAGTKADQEGHAMNEGTISTTDAGQYCVLPVKSSPWVGLTVIPSMQAFSVFANGENPKLKFDYRELVYNPSTNGTAAIVPTRAPRRTAEEDSDAPTVLRLAVTGESGYAAKIVLLERNDFSDNFDDGWDGRFMAGDDAAPQLYAVTPDGNMAINSIPNIEGTLLGFKAGEADDVFTFSFDYDGEALYLYDTHLQIYTRVMAGNTYAFTTTDNEAHNRFILTHNAPGVATGIEPVNNPSQVTNKMIIDNHLYIFRGGVLYDALGRMIGNGKEAGL